MTRTTNARLAGFTFLFYSAVAFPEMVLRGRATYAWLPMLVFEVTLALWLLIKGVREQKSGTIVGA